MTSKSFNINKIISDKVYYKKLIRDIKSEILLNSFEFRNKEVNVIIKNSDENKSFKTTIKDLLVNLILQKPFVNFGYEVSFDYWYDSKNNKSKVSDHFNTLIELFSSSEDMDQLNIEISEIISNLSDIAVDTNAKAGTSVSAYELIQVMKENPRLEEIFNTNFDNTGDFRDIEAEIDLLSEEACSIIENSNGSFKELLKGGAINRNQFKQIIVSLGPKPDMQGRLQPHLPDTNLLNGIRDVEDLFAMAKTARKILIIANKSVRDSGYLTRKLSLLTIDTVLDEELDDCGSGHYLKMLIENKDILNRLKNRWYEEDGELILVDENDENLIGRTINLRSPITCCSKNICRTCYGNLYKVNAGLHVGIIAVLYLTSQLTQKLLSAKHLLQTKSPVIDWSEDFLNIFEVDKTQIFFNETNTGLMIIKDDDIIDDEELGKQYIERFTIDNSTKAKPNRIIEIELPVKVYFHEEFFEQLPEYHSPEGLYEIRMKNFNEEPAFNIYIENEEITDSLKMIINLIEKKEHLGVTDYHEMMQTMISLLSANGISLDSVHAELIIRNLIRSEEDHSSRLDFSKEELDEYVMLRIKSAIIDSDTISVALSFEELKKQLLNVNTLKKDGESLLDDFFLV